MMQEGFSEPRELQGHLLRYAQRFLARQGRVLMGWEEAAEGGKLEKDAPILAWTGEDAVAKLATSGHPVIACPAPWAYLDLAWNNAASEPGLYWAGTADLRTCYQHSPYPERPDGTELENVLGVQANLWSELVSTPERLQYMLFPRLFATAEWAWSQSAGCDWNAFRSSAQHHLQRLSCRGVRGRPLTAED
jgi:hexosaminidase